MEGKDNPQFEPIGEPAPVQPPSKAAPDGKGQEVVDFSAPEMTEVVMERGSIGDIEVLDGQRSNVSDVMRELNPPKLPEKAPAKAEKPPENPPMKEPLEPSKSAKDPLILGRFKSHSDLEKSYKELEKAFHDPARVKKYKEREGQLERELETARKELELRSKNPGFTDKAPDATQFNEAIAENPGEAIQTELDRRELAREKKWDADQAQRRDEALRADIAANVNHMEDNYSEFGENRKAFADWLTELGADTNAICSSKNRLERTYGEFIAAAKSMQEFANEQREAGAAEALDKHAQVPPSKKEGNIPPPDQRIKRGGDDRFQPIGEPDVPSDLIRPPTRGDSLDEMEAHLGIGQAPRSMW